MSTPFLSERGFSSIDQEEFSAQYQYGRCSSHYVKRDASLIEDLSQEEVPSRIAKYLLDLSLKQSKEEKSLDENELDLSRSQLASRLGTIRETLSKTLAEMKDKSIIDVKKNRILILNREVLEKLASGLKL